MMRKFYVWGALALLAACSGASETELFEPARSQQSGTEPGSGTSPVGNSSGGSSTKPPPPPDAGTTPPPPPPVVCSEEADGNNKISDATPFAGCLTGKVEENDVDYGETTAPITAMKVTIEHEETGGKVSYRVYINGVAATPAFTGAAPAVKAVPGAKYQFRMSTSPANDDDERTYTLRVTFE